MLETNVRIVHPGEALYVMVRELDIKGPRVGCERAEQACGLLRAREGLAAVPMPGHPARLLVASRRPTRPLALVVDDFELEIVDAGRDPRPIRLDEPQARHIVAQLLERALLAKVASVRDYWTLDSPRIFWECRPFRTAAGIAAYRRFGVTAFHLLGEGIGIAVEISTGFLTVANLGHVFDQSCAQSERDARIRRFEQMTGRQSGQKGTLVYSTTKRSSKCYFEGQAGGLSCESTGRIWVKGQSFESLADYYAKTYPGMRFNPDGPVVRVSFPGIDKTQFVAAELVRVRVMNSQLAEELSNVDKIRPEMRRELSLGFWASLGARPLGLVAPGLESGFWQPKPDRITQIAPPVLTFGGGNTLAPPESLTEASLRAHFRKRMDHLMNDGCYSTPALMPRTLHVAYPRQVEDAAKRLSEDLTAYIVKWTRVPVSASLIPYDSLSTATGQLRSAGRGGVALFVLTEDPAAYFDVAYQLDDWRLKRVTPNILCQHYQNLRDGAWDRRSGARDTSLGRSRWLSFVHLTAIDLLQVLDVVPYRVENLGAYQAQLAIDVGQDRRYLALSLLLARPRSGGGPSVDGFRLLTRVHAKIDHRNESINPVVLKDAIIEIIDCAAIRPDDQIESVLVVRDGVLPDQELKAIHEAAEELKARRKLSSQLTLDVAEVFKDSLSRIRLWEVGNGGKVVNPLEGTVVSLDESRALVAATGRATLTQGTAECFLVHARTDFAAAKAAASLLAASQPNWGNPGVAQRLAITLKRTDEELTSRAAQEIRRIQ